MYAASAAHVLVGAIAFFARLGASSPGWPWDIIASTFVFSTLWLISGALFRRAA